MKELDYPIIPDASVAAIQTAIREFRTKNYEPGDSSALINKAELPIKESHYDNLEPISTVRETEII